MQKILCFIFGALSITQDSSSLHFLRGDKHESLSEDLYFLCFDIHGFCYSSGVTPTPLAACPLAVSSSNFLSALQLLLFFHQLLGMFPTAELVDTALSFKTQSSPPQSIQSWWDGGKTGWVETGLLREQAAQDVGSPVQLGTRNESASSPAPTIFLSCISHRPLHTVTFPSFLPSVFPSFSIF